MSTSCKLTFFHCWCRGYGCLALLLRLLLLSPVCVIFGCWGPGCVRVCANGFGDASSTWEQWLIFQWKPRRWRDDGIWISKGPNVTQSQVKLVVYSIDWLRAGADRAVNISSSLQWDFKFFGLLGKWAYWRSCLAECYIRRSMAVSW